MSDPKIDRWALFTDTVLFQVKLGMDAIRDVLLSPVSIIFALIDLIAGNTHKQSYFYALMRIGHKSDSWINLFGTRNREQTKKTDSEQVSEQKSDIACTTDNSETASVESSDSKNIDQLFSQMESLIKEQHNKGGLTASAKASIDKYLDKIIAKQDQ